MKITRFISFGAATAVALSLAGCTVRTGTNLFESCITSVDLKDDDIIASPAAAELAENGGLDISYLEFKKEYLYYLHSMNAQDDSKDEKAATYASQREYIINYLVNERIINDKAHQMGLDNFTQEELDKLEEDFQKNLTAQYEYFGEAADYGTLAAGETVSEDEKLLRGEQEFDKYLADCLMTKDDLLVWQRNALIAEKVEAEITKDVVIERSEAEDVLNGYIEEVKAVYAEDPEAYETTGTYTSFWLPEGSRNIKHILIGLEEIDSDEIMALRSSGDDEGADALRKEKLADIKQQADEIVNMLDNGADFDELIAEYSADAAGSAAFPNGYTVIPDSISYVDEFVDAAYSISNIGEYVLAASDYGWHIVMYASDASVPQEDLDMFIGYIEETLVDKAKTAKYEETLAQWAEEYAYEIDYEALALTAPSQTAETAASDAA